MSWFTGCKNKQTEVTYYTYLHILTEGLLRINQASMHQNSNQWAVSTNRGYSRRKPCFFSYFRDTSVAFVSPSSLSPPSPSLPLSSTYQLNGTDVALAGGGPHDHHHHYYNHHHYHYHPLSAQWRWCSTGKRGSPWSPPSLSSSLPTWTSSLCDYLHWQNHHHHHHYHHHHRHRHHHYHHHHHHLPVHVQLSGTDVALEEVVILIIITTTTITITIITIIITYLCTCSSAAMTQESSASSPPPPP